MRRRSKIGLILIVIGALLVMATTAAAQTTGEAPDFASYPELEEIAEDMEALWNEQPELFAKLEDSRNAVVQLDAQSGSRPVPVGRILQGAGDEALMPMLWHLVSENPMEVGMDLRTWRSWRIGLVEAVGRIRDERSIPVLYAIVVGNEPHEQLRTTATTAIGRTADLEAIDEVIEVARRSESKRGAIIAGLGKARRYNAAEYLLEVAQSPRKGDHQVLAVRALGDWVNQMAWRTPNLEPYADERQRVVDVTVEFLVDAYPRAEGMLSTEIEKSLQLAGAQMAKERAKAQLAQADKERRERLERLVEVMERSPLE